MLPSQLDENVIRGLKERLIDHSFLDWVGKSSSTSMVPIPVPILVPILTTVMETDDDCKPASMAFDILNEDQKDDQSLTHLLLTACQQKSFGEVVKHPRVKSTVIRVQVDYEDGIVLSGARQKKGEQFVVFERWNLLDVAQRLRPLGTANTGVMHLMPFLPPSMAMSGPDMRTIHTLL